MRGFRTEQRFTDPAEPVAAERTAPTLPAGLRAAIGREPGSTGRRAPAVPRPVDQRAAGQVKRAPSDGWRTWLYVVSGKLINVGEGPAVRATTASSPR